MQDLQPPMGKHGWYALKIQNVKSSFQRRLIRKEYQILAEVGQAIGAFTRAEKGKNQELIVMELAPGADMEKVIVKEHADQSLAPLCWMQIVTNTLLEIEKIYKKGYLHRDIKPKNLIVDKTTRKVTVIDLGLAGKMDRYQGIREEAMGTPLYMAPEILRAKNGLGTTMVTYSEKTEIYALGKTIAEILGLATDWRKTQGIIIRDKMDLELLSNTRLPHKNMRDQVIDFLNTMVDPPSLENRAIHARGNYLF